MKKLKFASMLLAVVFIFWIAETAWFGFNLKPESEAEKICDMIVRLGFLVFWFLIAGKGFELLMFNVVKMEAEKKALKKMEMDIHADIMVDIVNENYKNDRVYIGEGENKGYAFIKEARRNKEGQISVLVGTSVSETLEGYKEFEIDPKVLKSSPIQWN